jgi:hypothetical protein
MTKKTITFLLLFFLINNSFAKKYFCPKTPFNTYIGQSLWKGGKVEFQGKSLSEIETIWYNLFGSVYQIDTWEAYAIASTLSGNSTLECCRTIPSTTKKNIILCAKKPIINANCKFYRSHKNNRKVDGFDCLKKKIKNNLF